MRREAPGIHWVACPASRQGLLMTKNELAKLFNSRRRHAARDRSKEHYVPSEVTRRAVRQLNDDFTDQRISLQERQQKARVIFWNENDARFVAAYRKGAKRRERWAASLSSLPVWPPRWRNPRTLAWDRLSMHIRHARFFLCCGRDMKDVMAEVERAAEHWPQRGTHVSARQFRKANLLMEEILHNLRKVNHRTDLVTLSRKPTEEAKEISRLTAAWNEIMDGAPALEKPETPEELPAPSKLDAQRGHMVLLRDRLGTGVLKDEITGLIEFLETWGRLRAKLPNDKRRMGDYWIGQISDACGKMAREDDLLASDEARQGLCEMIADVRARLNKAAESISSDKVSSFMGDLSALKRQVR